MDFEFTQTKEINMDPHDATIVRLIDLIKKGEIRMILAGAGTTEFNLEFTPSESISMLHFINSLNGAQEGWKTGSN